MPVRLLALLVVAALAALGWLQRDAWWPRAAATAFDLTPAPAAPRKCAGPAGVVYTDGGCPRGTRVEPMSAGRINVVPAVRASPAAAPASASTLRDLALPTGVPTLRERAMERLQ
jgi:hypothetical protein